MLGGTLGPYRLDRELGAGGMGKVWAARVEGRVPGLDVGATVALKVVHPHLLETPGFFKRFLREAEIGKAVVHENVVCTFDCDAVAASGVQHHFLVMEYVEGQTLRALLEELERVPEELCRHIGREVAKGLAAIHAAGVVHRDLKPENVLITKDHAVKVMDLGVARLQDEAMRLSQTGAFVGSLHYAAPEAFREGGKDVDGRADLHALGLVLYELACGVNPYFAESVPETLQKVLHETPRRLGDVNPQLSPFFEEVVHCLLAKKPDERFADANALSAVLGEGEKSAWWTSRAKAIREETHRPLRRIRIPRETEVHGRDAEIATLRALFEKAKASDGQVVLIEGEAGIGKSRLVDELVGRLQRDGENLNFLFGSYPPGGAATASGALSTAFREQFGDASVAAYLAQTPLLVPAFEALLRGDATPAGCEPLTRESIATCFVLALRGLAGERPTVLLVDDLHFANEDARAMFASLALAVPGHRMLLVGTTRPGNDEKWLAGLTRLPQTSRMTVARLGPKDLIRLLQDSFRSEALAASLGAQVALKSDGNPFFAFEIVRGLREGRFISQTDDGSWVSTGVIGEIRIPSSVLDLVNARVADLSEEERNLLDVAACCGFEFDPGLVGDVLGLARISVLRAFGQIERRHRLVRASGRDYAFDHHQVQEALYGSLHEQMREEYHAALASALETRTNGAQTDPGALGGALCVDLAEHFLRGAQGRRALRYLDAALSHLEKGWLNEAAVRLADRALAAPGLVAGIERFEILLRKAALLDVTARSDAERAALEEALAVADADGALLRRARARSALAWHLHRVGRQADAQALLGEALELARGSGDLRTEAAVTGRLGSVFYALGRYPEAQARYERQLALAKEIGNSTVEASAATGLGNVLANLGLFADAQAQFERGIALAREFGDRRLEGKASGGLGGVFNALSRPEEAMAQHQRSFEIAREVGDRRLEAYAVGNLGLDLVDLGRGAEAQAQYELQLRLSRELGDRRGEAIGLVNLGPLRHSFGDLAGARRDLTASLDICREIGERFPAGFALLSLAAVADDEGDPVLALRLAQESLDLRRALGHGAGVAMSLERIADMRRAAGDIEGARAAIVEALALSRAQGRKQMVASGLALLSALCGGRRETLHGAVSDDPAARPGDDPQAGLAASGDVVQAAALALAEVGDTSDHGHAHFLLWLATRDRVHLAEAKRRLDVVVDQAPPACREAMLTNLRQHREIMAAAKAEGL